MPMYQTISLQMFKTFNRPRESLLLHRVLDVRQIASIFLNEVNPGTPTNVNVGEAHKKLTSKAILRHQINTDNTLFRAAAGLEWTSTSHPFEVTLPLTTFWFVFECCRCKGSDKTHRIQ